MLMVLDGVSVADLSRDPGRVADEVTRLLADVRRLKDELAAGVVPEGCPEGVAVEVLGMDVSDLRVDVAVSESGDVVVDVT